MERKYGRTGSHKIKHITSLIQAQTTRHPTPSSPTSLIKLPLPYPIDKDTMNYVVEPPPSNTPSPTRHEEYLRLITVLSPIFTKLSLKRRIEEPEEDITISKRRRYLSKNIEDKTPSTRKVGTGKKIRPREKMGGTTSERKRGRSRRT